MMSDARRTRDGDVPSHEDVVVALSLADGHLEDAENVLWNATRATDDEELAEALEELTRGVWQLQHELDDLRRRVE